MSVSLKEYLLALHRDTQLRHPETRPGEIWVTNVHEAQFDALVFNTKRRGINAYYKNGTVIEHFVPVFISLEEFHGIDWENMPWFPI